jgi:hypothetical protein
MAADGRGGEAAVPLPMARCDAGFHRVGVRPGRGK